MNKIYQKIYLSKKNPAKGKIGGFTLIELLVVVLIIGILSAVALPQYEKAVMKSRFASMMPIVKALADAEELYYLENGEYTSSFDSLSIQPPAGGVPRDGESLQYKDFYCRLWIADHNRPNVYCHGNKTGYYRKNLLNSSDLPGAQLCVVYPVTDDTLRKFCRSFGGVEISRESYNAYTIP